MNRPSTYRPNGLSAKTQVILVSAVVLTALNLRPTLASVGPLAGLIELGTGLTPVAIGLLTTLPLLAFATLSPFTSALTNRFGLERTIALAMLLAGLGGLMRAGGHGVMLFGGTIVLGAGIALGNVCLPAIVKRYFPHRAGIVTSVYAAAIALGSAIAAGLSLPLAQATSWPVSLAAWAAPALLVGVLWWSLREGPDNAVPEVGPPPTLREQFTRLSSSGLAWAVALFFGLQSLVFYVVIAWLPSILVDAGFSPRSAGWLLSLTLGTGIIGTAAGPYWGGRREDQRLPLAFSLGLEATAVTLLIGGPSYAVAICAAVLLGVALGAGFGLALLFLVVRAPDSRSATALSGLAQSVGYGIAAVGPPAFGAAAEWFGDWDGALFVLLVVIGVKSTFALRSGRAEVV